MYPEEPRGPILCLCVSSGPLRLLKLGGLRGEGVEGGEGEQAVHSPIAGGGVASQFHKVEHRLVSLISLEAFVFLPDAAAGNCLHVNKTWSVSPAFLSQAYRFVLFWFSCSPLWLNLRFLSFFVPFIVAKVIRLATGDQREGSINGYGFLGVRGGGVVCWRVGECLWVGWGGLGVLTH